jgi:hypothetical protein
MQFPTFNYNPSQMLLPEKLAQISLMLQNNYTTLARLEEVPHLLIQRINSLADLNIKIKKELAMEESIQPRSTPMIESTAPEERLIEKIFMKKDYSYYLILTSPLKLPLFKDRNFNLQVGLFDKEHRPASNCTNITYTANSIPLQIALYSCSEKPEHIESNKQGNDIFKGNTSVDLACGSACFQKLSIREVFSFIYSGYQQVLKRIS